MYSFRKPHTTPRTIPDRSAKLLYLQRLLRTSCCRTATMLFWTSMIKTLFFASSQNVTSQTTQPHVNHHYRSRTRPPKATDVRIKRRIFNDCTGNGDFEFSVDLTNLFWRDKWRACALSWTSPFNTLEYRDKSGVNLTSRATFIWRWNIFPVGLPKNFIASIWGRHLALSICRKVMP